MPNLGRLAAAAALLSAVIGGVARAWQAVADAVASAPAFDAATHARQRFAAVRAELLAAGVTQVGLVRPTPNAGPAEAAVIDLVAPALHRLLTTGVNEPPPPFDRPYLQAIADGFRASFPAAANSDAARVKDNLHVWWTSLFDSMTRNDVQYGLAPLLLKDDSEWLVGDLPADAVVAEFAASRHLTIVTNHGRGVVSFRRQR